MMRLTLGDHFERMVSAVELLHKNNARHKRGFRLQDVEPHEPMLRAMQECLETLLVASCSVTEIEDELGDVFGCLLHYALVQECDLTRVIRAWLNRIPEDFPGSAVMTQPGEG